MVFSLTKLLFSLFVANDDNYNNKNDDYNDS